MENKNENVESILKKAGCFFILLTTTLVLGIFTTIIIISIL